MYIYRGLPFSFPYVLGACVGVRFPTHSKLGMSSLSDPNHYFPSFTGNNALVSHTESVIFILLP